LTLGLLNASIGAITRKFPIKNCFTVKSRINYLLLTTAMLGTFSRDLTDGDRALYIGLARRD